MSDILFQDHVVRLAPGQAENLRQAAQRLDISESEVIRRALNRYLVPERFIARSSEAHDERLLRIRDYLGKVLSRARNWQEVQSMLRARGICYAPRGGGLIIKRSESDQILCKASEVGPAYRKLVALFGHFPGHPHVHIARKVADAEPSLIDDEDSAPLPLGT